MTEQHLMDMNKFPEDERPHLVELGTKYNAFVNDASRKFDATIGDTEQEIHSTGRILMSLRLLERGAISAALKTSSVLLPVLIGALIMKLFGLNLGQLKELLGLFGNFSG